MPQILGLEEQKQALNKISQMLKELSSINEFLEMENSTSLYEISFVKEEPENEMDSEENEKKKGKKQKVSAPFLCPDPQIVRQYVLAYKNERVNTVRELADTYRISLNYDDEKILNDNTTTYFGGGN